MAFYNWDCKCPTCSQTQHWIWWHIIQQRWGSVEHLWTSTSQLQPRTQPSCSTLAPATKETIKLYSRQQPQWVVLFVCPIDLRGTICNWSESISMMDQHERRYSAKDIDDRIDARHKDSLTTNPTGLYRMSKRQIIVAHNTPSNTRAENNSYAECNTDNGMRHSRA